MVSHVSRDILKYSGTLTSVHSRSPLKGGGSFNGSLSYHLFRIRDARPMTWYVCLRPVSMSHLALIQHQKTKELYKYHLLYLFSIIFLLFYCSSLRRLICININFKIRK